MTHLYNRTLTYELSKPETQEEVDARINSMPMVPFLKCVWANLDSFAHTGVDVKYEDGTPTPNGLILRALANRLYRELDL